MLKGVKLLMEHLDILKYNDC